MYLCRQKYLSFHFFKSSEFPLVDYFLIKSYTFYTFLRKNSFFLTFGPVLVPRTKKQKSKNFVCQGLQRFKVPKVHKNLGCWAPIVTLKHFLFFFGKIIFVFLNVRTHPIMDWKFCSKVLFFFQFFVYFFWFLNILAPETGVQNSYCFAVL